MIDFRAFSDELQKIAEGSVVPTLRRLPEDADEAFESIKRGIERSKTSILGHPSVAVPVGKLGDLEQHGFKRTRLAVPIPGERIGTPSWRQRGGQLHAHRKGEHYLMHKDRLPPLGGPLVAAKHWVEEGIPATIKRFTEREASIAR